MGCIPLYMSPRAVLLCYLVLAALQLAWDTLLALLNLRSVRRGGGAVPQELAGIVTAQAARSAAEYSSVRLRFGMIRDLVSTALVLAVAATGLFGLLDRALRDAGLGGYWLGAAFLALIMAAQSILLAPFSIHATFGIERRFGFNTTAPSTWLLDRLKGALLSAALGLPLLYLLYRFIDGAGALWWFWAAVVFSVIDLVLSVLYPALIAPLFNRFSPLAEGSLRERIGELSGRLGFRVNGIFVMDGSRRSRHSNAYFTGLGRTKRIVLYDTLLGQLSEDEILAVLAHEIGHEKKRHVIAMTAVSIALSFVGFWVLALLMDWDALYRAFGFAGPSKHALILVVSLLSGPGTFVLTPLLSWWSRRHEYQADAYAAAATDPASLSSALVKLNAENASNLWPHPLYAAWYYSHPTLVERLRGMGIQKVSGSSPRS